MGLRKSRQFSWVQPARASADRLQRVWLGAPMQAQQSRAAVVAGQPGIGPHPAHLEHRAQKFPVVLKPGYGPFGAVEVFVGGINRLAAAVGIESAENDIPGQVAVEMAERFADVAPAGDGQPEGVPQVAQGLAGHLQFFEQGRVLDRLALGRPDPVVIQGVVFHDAREDPFIKLKELGIAQVIRVLALELRRIALPVLESRTTTIDLLHIILAPNHDAGDGRMLDLRQEADHQPAILDPHIPEAQTHRAALAGLLENVEMFQHYPGLQSHGKDPQAGGVLPVLDKAQLDVVAAVRKAKHVFFQGIAHGLVDRRLIRAGDIGLVFGGRAGRPHHDTIRQVRFGFGMFFRKAIQQIPRHGDGRFGANGGLHSQLPGHAEGPGEHLAGAVEQGVAFLRRPGPGTQAGHDFGAVVVPLE